MPTRPENREKVRCPNRECPHYRTGGRILFERAAGFVFKESAGGSVVVMGVAIMAKCQDCGQHWINPEVQMFDGIAQILEQAVASAAERVRQGVAGVEPPKGRAALRRVV